MFVGGRESLGVEDKLFIWYKLGERENLEECE
jgi:hypothetical protein